MERSVSRESLRQAPDGERIQLADDPAFDRSRATARPRWWLAVAALVWLVAFCVRLVPVLRGGGLTGASGLDPAVYYAAAAGWVRGRLPYQDFLLLHPPGAPELLLPFALLARVTSEPVGMAVARVVVMAMGATTAVVVARILRGSGAVSALVGGLAYALFWPAVYVERSTWLEGFGSFLTALGMALVLGASALARRSPRAATVLAGVCLGFACTVKLWSAVVLLAVLAWHLARRKWPDAGLLVLGALGAVTASLAPFLGVLPRLWEMTVVAQSGRLDLARAGLLPRLGMVAGLPPTWSNPWLRAVAVVAVLLVAGRALSDRTGRFAALLFAASLMLLLVAPQFYRHYPAVVAAPLTVLLGLGAGRWLAQLRSHRLRVVILVVLAGVGAVAALLAAHQRVDTHFDGPGLAAVAWTHPGCVTTDDPTALIAADLIGSNLADGCRLVVDLTGYRYYLGGPADLRANPAWQEFYREYMSSGSLAVLTRKHAWDEMDDRTRALMRTWTTVGEVSGRPVLSPRPA